MTYRDVLKFEGTADTRQLCQRVSDASGGICFLGFSRGKDSAASWLWLNQFFDRVIPFHLSPWPGLRVVKEGLDYFEQFFKTKIHRFLDPIFIRRVKEYHYQWIGDEDQIDSLDYYRYDMTDVVYLLREEYNLPDVPCAFGLSMFDSFYRRMTVKAEAKGVASEAKNFIYPCFDWRQGMVFDIINQSKIELPGDYLFNVRSFQNFLPADMGPTFKALYPDDYEKLLSLFPFMEASFARNEFRKQKWEQRHPKGTKK